MSPTPSPTTPPSARAKKQVGDGFRTRKEAGHCQAHGDLDEDDGDGSVDDDDHGDDLGTMTVAVTTTVIVLGW